ncbi:autophagy-related protein 23-like [Miscanthus floridulus]|uniref:autophagy-related protein 23-like n=1 Tax=Miscanthus floridulus TaxID=154761 RepID=UPI00345A1283
MSARPTAEADTPETRALAKRAVSPLGSTAEVEQVAAGPAPPRVERALESGEAVEATVGAAETPSAVEATEGEVEVEAPSVVEATEGGVEVKAPSVVEATEGGVEVEAPSVVEATEGEVKVEASMVAEALRTSGAEVVEIAVPRNFGAEVVEAGVSAARAVALEVEMKARQASTLPPIQSALPELEARSFGKSLFLRRERGVWDELCRQRELLTHANELLSARSVEAEDLHLRCDNWEAEAAIAQGQVAPLAARVKELQEELTRVADERDASNSRAEEVRATAVATTGQLGAEQRAHELTKGALAEATKAAEASQGEALKWREKAEGLDDEVSWLTEASVALQTVLDREIEEHEALQSAACAVCEALEMEGVQSGSSLRSRLTALIGQAHQRLREALHTGVKRALAVVSLHYASIDVEGISDGYVMSEDAVEAEEELTRLEAAVEGPGTALAKLFEEEVVPPLPSADAGDPAP